jgi:hypothetical protein
LRLRPRPRPKAGLYIMLKYKEISILVKTYIVHSYSKFLYEFMYITRVFISCTYICMYIRKRRQKNALKSYYILLEP